GTQPGWAALLARARGHDGPAQAWLGIVVAVGGAVHLTGVDVALSGRALVGDLLALAGGALAAAYVTVGGEVRQTVSTTLYTTICYSTAAAVLGLLCLGGGQALGGFDGRTWLCLLALTAGPLPRRAHPVAVAMFRGEDDRAVAEDGVEVARLDVVARGEHQGVERLPVEEVLERSRAPVAVHEQRVVGGGHQPVAVGRRLGHRHAPGVGQLPDVGGDVDAGGRQRLVEPVDAGREALRHQHELVVVGEGGLGVGLLVGVGVGEAGRGPGDDVVVGVGFGHLIDEAVRPALAALDDPQAAAPVRLLEAGHVLPVAVVGAGHRHHPAGGHA